jgi:hypothetical protein
VNNWVVRLSTQGHTPELAYLPLENTGLSIVPPTWGRAIEPVSQAAKAAC